MNLIGKLIISLVVASIVYAAAWLLPSLPLFPLLLVATLGTSVLTSYPVGANSAAVGQTSTKARPAAKPQAKPKASRQEVKKPATRKTKPSKDAPVAKAAPTPASGPREEGEVKWFNISKGFGFITKDGGEEIFVHFRSIRGEGRRGLKDGQRVSFVHSTSDKGPQAEDVEAI